MTKYRVGERRDNMEVFMRGSLEYPQIGSHTSLFRRLTSLYDSCTHTHTSLSTGVELYFIIS